MLPRDLTLEMFSGYPPEARRVVAAHLAVLRRLPLSFLPSLLREISDYDYRFPVERSAIDRELDNLAALAPSQLDNLFSAFDGVSLSPALEQSDWINAPAQFVEKQSAWLWSTHQLDAFRKAATDYGARLQSAAPPQPPPLSRIGIAVIGQGVAGYSGTLFKNLRQHGTSFSQVKPENGWELILAAVTARASQHPQPYAHWYIDGGAISASQPLLTQVSYEGLAPLRASLLKRMQAEIQVPGMGPEELRTNMAQLAPSDLGMDPNGDAILDRFRLKLFTEGSGTQIYSTTFAQWATREALRRAQALTLLVRYAPRQRQRPMNELLADLRGGTEPDLEGSIIDADMAAWYHWINQQRLPGSEQSSFLVWFEGHPQALAIGPSLPRGTESKSPLDLKQLLALIGA